MELDPLRIHAHPVLADARLVLGFSGWMDGGEVSTGTVECLIERLGATVLADIDPADFYICGFPGPMEIAALVRPTVNIENGLIRSLGGPSNVFYVSPPHNLILFLGREPHLNWAGFADATFRLAARFGVSMIYFIGSVAGLVPHTRLPRLHASMSDEALRPMLTRLGVRFTSYQGPASFATYLTARAPRHNVRMADLVAEIPAYVQGRNPRCIRAVAQRLMAVLDAHVDTDDLKVLADQMEEQLNRVISQQPELGERISKLEADYDNDVFDTEMGDLKDWLQQQGIRLD